MEEESIVLPGGIALDDRGHVSFVNNFTFHGVKRFYSVSNHRSGFIRAWHAHQKEAKYIYVASGAAVVGTVRLSDEIVKRYTLSSTKPAVVYVPTQHANGFKTLTENTVVMFFSTSTLEESEGDDQRFPYDQWNIWQEDYR